MQEPIKGAKSFNETLYQKADEYFASQPLGKHATGVFAAKSVLLLAIYIAAYIHFLFLSNDLSDLMIASVLLGFCHVLIPVNISHDAIHQAVSSRGWINSICLCGFELTGVNSFLYSQKHLEAHHNKENGNKMKVIETQSLLMQKKKSGRIVNLHWILYLFYAQYMIFIRDFMIFYSDPQQVPARHQIKLFLFKGLYLFAFLILPFIFIDLSWLLIAASLVFMYLIVTLSLVLILLMPTEKMEHVKTDGHNANNDEWAIEILKNNVDFSPGIPALNLLAGGANMNVVHYLFPSVCHIHYNRIAEIIDDVTTEYGLLYRKQLVIDVFSIHYHYIKNIQNGDDQMKSIT